MWWGRRKNQPQRVEPFSIGKRLEFDVHSHLVPGVDDGASNLSESLALVDRLVALGYRGAVLTPHIYTGLYPNSKATLSAPFAALQAAVKERHPMFTLHLAAEYFTDEHFMQCIQRDDLLSFPVGDARAVLFEMGFQEAAPNVDEAVFELQLNGYQPVLAHVERYPYLVADARALGRLEDRGVWLTVNAASLAGAYGPEIRTFAAELLASGRARMLCSDAHGDRHLQALEALQTDAAVHRALEAGHLDLQRQIP